VVISASATGYRSASRGIGKGGNTLTIILLPIANVLITDADRRPLPDVMISHKPFQFRRDGLVYQGNRGEHVRSNRRGELALDSELTIRRAAQPILIAATDISDQHMGFRFVWPAEITEKFELELANVCEVTGTVEYIDADKTTGLGLLVLDEDERTIAVVPPITSEIEHGVQARYRFRMPPGKYSLRTSRGAPQFKIDITVEANEKRVSFDERVQAANGD